MCLAEILGTAPKWVNFSGINEEKQVISELLILKTQTLLNSVLTENIFTAASFPFSEL